jgi:hypothetical protein
MRHLQNYLPFVINIYETRVQLFAENDALNLCDCHYYIHAALKLILCKSKPLDKTLRHPPFTHRDLQLLLY